MSWKIVDHTADMGLEVRTDTLEGLFIEAARGLYFVCLHGGAGMEHLESGERESIRVDGLDLEELMVSWLNELLFVLESRSLLFLPSSVHLRKTPLSLFSEGTLAAVRPVSIPVKAATYGGLVLREVPEPFLRIFLDM